MWYLCEDQYKLNVIVGMGSENIFFFFCYFCTTRISLVMFNLTTLNLKPKKAVSDPGVRGGTAGAETEIIE
jgi:hypothetical protein